MHAWKQGSRTCSPLGTGTLGTQNLAVFACVSSRLPTLTYVLVPAIQIERRYGSQGLHGLSLHPGGIMTPLARHMAEEDLKAFGTPDKQRMFKSPEQGAATTVWAAVAPDWEGKGGKYLEDCRDAEEVKSKDEWGGYAPHAYDVEAAKKLWHLSLQLVGLPSAENELD